MHTALYHQACAREAKTFHHISLAFCCKAILPLLPTCYHHMFTQHKLWCPEVSLLTWIVVLCLVDLKEQPPCRPVWAPHLPKQLTDFLWVCVMALFTFPAVCQDLVLLKPCEGWRPHPHHLLAEPEKVLFVLHQLDLQFMEISIPITSPTNIRYHQSRLLALISIAGRTWRPIPATTMPRVLPMPPWPLRPIATIPHSTVWLGGGQSSYARWYVCSVHYVCLYGCICGVLCLGYLFSCPMFIVACLGLFNHVVPVFIVQLIYWIPYSSLTSFFTIPCFGEWTQEA